MGTVSIILTVATIAGVIGWLLARNSLWGAVTATLVLFLMSSLGWLWWWIPITATVVAFVGVLVALYNSSAIGRRILSILTTISLLLAGIMGTVALTSKDHAAFAADSKGLHTVEFDPKKDAIPAEAKCETDLFLDHSLRIVKAGDAQKRQFGTAVSIPFTGSDNTAITKEILAENCGNPTFLEMNLKEMLIWNDTLIPGADANKGWLNEIQEAVKANTLNGFVKNFQDEKKVTQKTIVTEEYQMYASWMNTVLLRFNEEGKQSPTSVRNWEQPATQDPTKGLPSVQEAKDQESKPAYVYILKDKNGKCLVKIGFNAEDRRIELFNCVEPEKTNPSTPGQPGGSTPSCTVNCDKQPPPPPCTVDCNPLTPKSSDPNDYRRPGDGGKGDDVGTGTKPPAPAPDKPASNPDPVDTSPPPVIQAPGPDVTPAPENPPTPPPNEGGNNDGSVAGGF